MIHLITEVTQTDQGIERRQAPRTAFGKPVVSVELEGESIMACVLDVSDSGACLLFPPEVDVPLHFKIDLNEKPRYAQVVWKRGAVVGVSLSAFPSNHH